MVCSDIFAILGVVASSLRKPLALSIGRLTLQHLLKMPSRLLGAIETP